MEQLGRHRLGLAGPEALHLAHLLTELFREWVCGGGRKFGEATTAWQSSLFGGCRADGRSGSTSLDASSFRMASAAKSRRTTMAVLPYICMAWSLPKRSELRSYPLSSPQPCRPRATLCEATSWMDSPVALVADCRGRKKRAITILLGMPFICSIVPWTSTWASAATVPRSSTFLNVTRMCRCSGALASCSSMPQPTCQSLVTDRAKS